MLCPKCKTLLAIARTRRRVTGDEDSETQTEVFVVQELVCRNKRCEAFGRTEAQAETRIYP